MPRQSFQYYRRMITRNATMCSSQKRYIFSSPTRKTKKPKRPSGRYTSEEKTPGYLLAPSHVEKTAQTSRLQLNTLKIDATTPTGYKTCPPSWRPQLSPTVAQNLKTVVRWSSNKICLECHVRFTLQLC